MRTTTSARPKNLTGNLLKRPFQFATKKYLLSVLPLSFALFCALFFTQGVAAQRFLDLSGVANYLPDSLRQIYSSPMLADDDVLFALDSSGNALYLNFASNRDSSVVVVVDPLRGKDSGLVWVSEPLTGHLDYFYAADINGDELEEIVVSSRKLGSSSWNRIHIWRWPADSNPDSVVALAPCSDSLNPYFQALTKVEVIDTGAAPDGILEVVVTSIVGGGGLVNRRPTTIKTIYYWNGVEYCVTR